MPEPLQVIQILAHLSDRFTPTAFAPNGHTLASASTDNLVKIWDISSCCLLYSFDGHQDYINSIAFAPDSTTLASASADTTIKLWDVASCRLLHSFEGHQNSVISLAFAPDGRTIASASTDNTIKLWDIASRRLLHSFEGHRDWVRSVIFSPDSKTLASASADNQVKLWDVNNRRLLYSFEGHQYSVISVAFAPDGLTLASASADNTVKLWDVASHRLLHSFEGHRREVTRVVFAPDGSTLTSTSRDGAVFVWDLGTKGIVTEEWWQQPTWEPIDVNYQINNGRKCIFVEIPYGDDDFVMRTISLSLGSQPRSFTRYVSAKVVLVGESLVGKSSLASRLAQDHYIEYGSTHGMKLWHVKPERLDPSTTAPEGEQREITIWDLGGQDEYRLVHQLFLQGTTLVLMLFSPDRGTKALDDVREWDLRLEKQKRCATTKLLIGTKADNLNHDLIDHNGINSLISDCHLATNWHLVSSKTGMNIDGLKAAILQAINWQELSATTRPVLFQRVRDAITERQQRGEVVLLYSELIKQISDADLPDNKSLGYSESEDLLPDANFSDNEPLNHSVTGKTIQDTDSPNNEPLDYSESEKTLEDVNSPDSEYPDSSAIRTVVDQLERQGMIVATALSSGQPALVLQIGFVEIYASSLILIAKNNARCMPALELAELDGMKSYPGIKSEERLHPFQERIVIECVVQLLLQHGLCLKHEGLLIFPSLFPTLETKEVSRAEIVSLYYDFTGAIDNIYSSLVVKLAHCERFGRVRLSGNRADFDQCILVKKDRRSGFAHLDLMFSKECSKDTRDLFINLVEDHLQREGVEIKEVLEIICTCGYKFEESLLKKRIDDNRSDVICPDCESRHPISEGAKKAREKNPAIEREMFALKTEIEKRNTQEALEVEMEIVTHKPDLNTPYRILHLSDLHFGVEDDVDVRLYQLSRDLKDKTEGMGFETLDYLVISGDLTNRATKEEFDNAYEFISGLIERFKLSAERCIIVPGNHDLSWDQEVYEWKQERLVDPKKLREGRYIKEGKLYGLRDEAKYPARFDNFSRFYHQLIQLPYPLPPEAQGVPFLYDEPRLQFLTMNSAWEIDEWHQERSGIHDKALAKMLTKADEQIDVAKKTGRINADAQVLRIAVWHHPVTGNEKIVDDAFLEQLRKADVKLCLHGHVHEDRADLVGYLHPTRKLHIAGAGSFGAGAKERPPAIPRLYNVVEIWRDQSKIRVHTRCLKKEGGAWEGWAVWPGADKDTKRSSYEIKLK